jgi:hypothetical protein
MDLEFELCRCFFVLRSGEQYKFFAFLDGRGVIAYSGSRIAYGVWRKKSATKAQRHKGNKR